MTNVSNRHEGDLGGDLHSIDSVCAVPIRVHVSENASALNVQHTVWMLINLLCRLERVVSKIYLDCPSRIALHPRVIPFGSSGELRSSLFEAAGKIDSVPVLSSQDGDTDFIIHVGPKPYGPASWNAFGDGWCGRLFRGAAITDTNSPLPLGPYVAACLAAGEVFRATRIKDYRACKEIAYSLWTYSTGDECAAGPPALEVRVADVLLSGVGAVGTAVLHTLWAASAAGTIWVADNDEKGVDDSNLNRYCLFSKDARGQKKASIAANLLSDDSLKLIPHDGGFEYFFSSVRKPRIVLSAVDKNSARHGIQSKYPPLMLSASTKDLRAELLRCGPPGSGACLACYNPLETNEKTEDEIRNNLKEAPRWASELYRELGISKQDAEAWVFDGKCSVTGERIVEHLRFGQSDVPQFAVGFVSVIAGAMLAGQLMKELARPTQILSEIVNRANFQFMDPISKVNRSEFYVRDGNCPKCRPNSPAVEVWAERFAPYRTAKRL